MAASPREALQLEGVHKVFGDFVALHAIDLAIHDGELVCFVGPSGCGKTTLLRIIAGLESATRGRILQRGRDITRAPPAARDYGIVFQSYALFPNLTVAENVAYGLVNRRTGRAAIAARVQELLALVGLPDAGPKYPSQCSGGQQQRVALARALATSPSLLLLDEPLSALDAKVRERLRGEIRQLQQRLGVTTILVTHDQEEALSMADRVVVMNAGRIEQIGAPQEVYERPATPFVADFLGKVNVLRAVCVGEGRYRVGQCELATQANGVAAGAQVRLYLRPEDRVLPDSGPVERLPNALRGTVKHVDFLGTYCLADVEVEGFDGQRLLVYYSLNQLRELGVREGAIVPFALRGERVRVFESER
ncbi:MAG TPA: putative 2-aminoethylphosphonate ABC transporter ATP-binding protein [Burkholderiaceae bacterium]|jgi:iron(III) transport system ATP-binding protein|nr:putative 2-aminoethylphosphonate ABC transporter ATP-binding protein [Burkholderiaceae bacterium]